MSRFLTLLILATVAYLLYKRFKGIRNDAPKTEQGSSDTEKVCKCLYCSAHTPQSRGVSLPSGQFFCSQEHQRLYLAKQEHPEK